MAESYTLDGMFQKSIYIFHSASKLRKLLQSIDPDILHARSRVPAWLMLASDKNSIFPLSPPCMDLIALTHTVPS